MLARSSLFGPHRGALYPMPSLLICREPLSVVLLLYIMPCD